MSGTQRPQGKANAIPASISKLSVTSSGLEEPTEQEESPKKSQDEMPVPDPPLPPNPTEQKIDPSPDKKAPEQQQASSAGWFGWWSRPDGYTEKGPGDAKKDTKEEETNAALETPLPGVSPLEERTQPRLVRESVNPPTPAAKAAPISDKDSERKPTDNAGSGRGWFWLWSSQQNAHADKPAATEERMPQSNGSVPKPQPEASTNVAAPPVAAPANQPLSTNVSVDSNKVSGKNVDRKKSTSWAFWSKETAASEDPGAIHKQVGELAVADTPSQTNPEAAQFNEQEEPILKEPPKSIARSIREITRGKESSSSSSTPAKTTPSHSPTRKSTESTKQPKEELKKDLNLLLPEFRNTYSLVQQPTVWQQLRRYLVGEETSHPHLHITPTPPRLKKALAIGIHGFFPSPLFQKVLGQPTGTSIRFANCAAQAVKSWTEEHGYDCEIEKIALEGEGFIADRIDTLWKLLLNWIDQIRSADFILVACHSQGVPVAINLVAKLIAFGCVTSTRIGICAMAGVNLGPFVEYKTRMFGGTALELFDFSNPSSKVSQAYQHALEEVLKFGVRIVYVGSIDDQLVSLEVRITLLHLISHTNQNLQSSTFSTVTHPYIYRAVFIDGRLHAADFISHLVGFCLKLRNLGIPDHGLIRELSPALAGSLYTGEGHSSLHNYLPIYQLAVHHALDTTSLEKPIKVVVKKYEGPPGAKDANPYFLPWAMRGILEEDVVRKELGDECENLLRLFEEWKPQSKGLKDVKFRLEAIRSKL
jgi:hypothetical protein